MATTTKPPALRATWLDRVVGFFSPRRELQRLRARLAHDLLARHYEGGAPGRRTQGWNKSNADPNAALRPYIEQLRSTARDLVRNNPNAKSALRTITNHVVGTGILARPEPMNARLAERWKQWAETTACDADGRNDFYGLQKLVIRTVGEAGECIIRRRLRLPTDDLPIPVQIQVLEPDFIDTTKTGIVQRNAEGTIVRRVVSGIEFNTIGQRTAYYLFREHPGSEFATMQSAAIPAESIVHVFYQDRPGQIRGASWFAPVLLRFKDYDEYEDATLMKQKIAACLAVILSDPNGTQGSLGTSDGGDPAIDSLEPGMLINAPPGRSITVVDPPSVRDYADYSTTQLRAIAAGLGIPYEHLTGDYAEMPFSAARMSHIAHWSRVEDWRWQMLIPQFCDQVWRWVMEVLGVMGERAAVGAVANWTAPPAPMVDPGEEGRAYKDNIRTGLQTLSEVIRERGYDPDEVLAERAKDDAKLDKLRIILDSDPRNTTSSGNPRQYVTSKPVGPDDPGGTAPNPSTPADEGGTDGSEEDDTTDAGGRARDREPRGRAAAARRRKGNGAAAAARR